MKTNTGKMESERVAVQTAMMMKLGIDLHAAEAVVCRQEGGQLPKPAQRMTPQRLVEQVGEWIQGGWEVHSCYEAGPCGYGLHRQLTAVGAHNLVVVPRRLDPGSRVKTDQRDARQLCDALDRYVQGNSTAFGVVRVPTLEQEQRRAISRQRGMLLKERQRALVRAHGLMLAAGVHAAAEWWRPKHWPQLSAQLSAELRERVQCWQKLAMELDQQLCEWSAKVEACVSAPAPKGIGALTAASLEVEVLDWHRFKGRRGVASYMGLCPGENSSGTRRRQGSITKQGNPRLRHWLIEAVWRLLQWQPDYPPLRRLRAATSPRQRKRLAVAAARRLAIDLWRINTKRCTPEQLGLRLK